MNRVAFTGTLHATHHSQAEYCDHSCIRLHFYFSLVWSFPFFFYLAILLTFLPLFGPVTSFSYFKVPKVDSARVDFNLQAPVASATLKSTKRTPIAYQCLSHIRAQGFYTPSSLWHPRLSGPVPALHLSVRTHFTGWAHGRQQYVGATVLALDWLPQHGQRESSACLQVWLGYPGSPLGPRLGGPTAVPCF